MTHLPRAAGDVDGVGSGLCRAYLMIATLGVAGYLLTSTDSWTQVGYRVGIGYFGVAAIIVGVLRYRPAGAAAWWFIAAGVFLNVTGQLAETVVLLRIQHKNTFPSIADVFYLGLYPGLIIGMVLLIRRRTLGRDLAATVDASTISIGLGLLSWVFFIEPVRADPSIKLLGSVVSVAYPVFDVLVLRDGRLARRAPRRRSARAVRWRGVHRAVPGDHGRTGGRGAPTATGRHARRSDLLRRRRHLERPGKLRRSRRARRPAVVRRQGSRPGPCPGGRRGAERATRTESYPDSGSSGTGPYRACEACVVSAHWGSP